MHGSDASKAAHSEGSSWKQWRRRACCTTTFPLLMDLSTNREYNDITPHQTQSVHDKPIDFI